MRRISAVLTVLSTAALLTAGAAAAGASAAPVQLSKATVQAGDVVEVSGEAGQEGLNWVASAAFVRQTDEDGDPYPGNGGSAHVTTDADGHFHGSARVAQVAPGSYDVSVRIGGGNAGSVTITVVAP